MYYQHKKNNPYIIEDKALYKQVFWLIMRYENLIKQRENVIHGRPHPSDGMPRGNKIANPTQDKAIKLIELSKQIEAIEQTVSELRGKYSKTYTGELFEPYESFIDYGVFCYYRSRPGKDTAPARETWSRYRGEFVYLTARNLNYV